MKNIETDIRSSNQNISGGIRTGGIIEYEKALHEKLMDGEDFTAIRAWLLQEQKDVEKLKHSPKNRLMVNGYLGTGYDKIDHELHSIRTVIDRLDKGKYPKKSWHMS